MDDDVDPGFDTVRTTLQSALNVPFAVTITSSQPRDGKTRLAVGTARAFADAGFSTILVDANPANPSIAEALNIAALPLVPLPLPPAGEDPPPPDAAALAIRHGEPRLDAASIASHNLLDDIAPATVRGLTSYLRKHYDVTIIDACTVPYAPFCAQIAAACDGVVLAVRYARNPDPDDDRLVAKLEKLGARIIGSVPTSFPDRPWLARLSSLF